MADWSQLLPELLTLIAERLETQFDVLRFRSVCSSWRSSYKPKVYPLPTWFPPLTKGKFEFSFSRIARNTLYLVRLPRANQRAPSACWLVNIRDGDGTQILKPLSDSDLSKPLPENFPKVLDLTNFQVIELGHQFFCKHSVCIDHPVKRWTSEYRQKVAIMGPSTNSNDYMMLTSFNWFRFNSCFSDVAFFRSGLMKSTYLENLSAVEDYIFFSGKFYVIQKEGRSIVFDQSFNVSFLERIGSPNSRKFLVRSGDNLLAVEMFYICTRISLSSAEGPEMDDSQAGGFRIFRFDEGERKWNEMESLGDQILFLGYGQAISASASEFDWGKGNLIFYCRDLADDPGGPKSKDNRMFVFDLVSGSASPVENCPAYRNLFFWPPPEWVTSAESVISSTQVISNSSATPQETEYESPDSHSADL